MVAADSPHPSLPTRLMKISNPVARATAQTLPPLSHGMTCSAVPGPSWHRCNQLVVTINPYHQRRASWPNATERDRLWTDCHEGVQKLWVVSFEHGYNFGHPIRTK